MPLRRGLGITLKERGTPFMESERPTVATTHHRVCTSFTAKVIRFVTKSCQESRTSYSRETHDKVVSNENFNVD
ncbi:hypothetical protein JTE90_028924 [Oedothorax gibbosus]|uniref:Uncharacterized protein n=1 Tax=Oedothorax gibbosus TaxID=931172 RepID=A0AAV6VJS6_9ARAC|nr:hypothetical protein JTE90_028924 [Oedothorax gibbosus]